MTTNKGQLFGITLLLLGVACLAALVFQLNSYITYSSVAGIMKTESQNTLTQLRNDPTTLATYGLNVSDLDDPQVSAYINNTVDSNVKNVYLQANALVLSMALDALFGIGLCYFGIRKAAQHS
ncbi:MAG: hypothetical protein WCX64_04395 [Candidatus Micrarchaeia archaeon]|jgi:hypothetical protein